MCKKNKLSLLLLPALLGIAAPPTFAAVNEGDGTIDITAGVSTLSNTPESAVAQAMSIFCPRLQSLDRPLNPEENRLSEICGILVQNQSLTEEAYKELSAHSVTSITTLLSHGPMIVSLEDIGSRLASLRRAARKLNVASWRNSEPLLAQTSILEATGGGASADEQGGLYDNRLSGFVSGAYVNSKQTETETLVGFKNDLYGLTLGLDYRFRHDAYAGIATRLLNGNADLDDNAGSLDSNDVNFTLYGTYFPTQSLYIDATVQANRGNYDLSRRIDFTVNTVSASETAEGSTDGDQVGFSLGTGYEYTFGGPAITAQLSGIFRYNKAKLDAYTEQGAMGLNLNVDEQTIETQLLTVGAQFSKAFSYSWGVLIPQLDVNWKHDFKTDGQDISTSFAADPFGTKFVFTTEDRDPDFFELALGVSTVNPGGWSGFLQWASVIGYRNYDQNMLSLGVRKEF
jgi:outer membrane autotransporter protein